MRNQEEQQLKDARAGDINAFQALFLPMQNQLRSYLYRLLANRADADDLTHDTFIRAFDKLHLFRGEASLKTWVFQIATNLTYTKLERRQRWTVDVNEQAKELVMNDPALQQQLGQVHQTSVEATYEIRHHIDTCFTCMGKTLPIENQIALILRDIYQFSVGEIGRILDKSAGQVKYLLQSARGTMSKIFDERCSLVNKQGSCHQCSELNGWFNPKQDQQEAINAIDMVRGSKKYDRESLFKMRVALVKAIDPLHSSGNQLQEALMECNLRVMGELA